TLTCSSTCHFSFFTRSAARRPPHSFPTRRSSDLYSSSTPPPQPNPAFTGWTQVPGPPADNVNNQAYFRYTPDSSTVKVDGTVKLDRKSTRLNSSHLVISYAVFCLKKKTPRKRMAC